MSDKCPFCYRPIGTHLKDPILLPNGAKYDWISETELVYEPDIDNRWYKGCYPITVLEIIELQLELQTLESENLPLASRTVFSPINLTGFFPITGKHIKELRDSIEKLWDVFGITATEYFNYDEDSNHIIHPNGDKLNWTDPITEATDLQKFQIKAIHIEDLRHYLKGIEIEKWKIADIGIPESSFYGDIGVKPVEQLADRPWFWSGVLCYPETIKYLRSQPEYYIENNEVKVRWVDTYSTVESFPEMIAYGEDNALQLNIKPYATTWDSQVLTPGYSFYSGVFMSEVVPSSISVTGYFKKNRPIATKNNLFNVDVNCTWERSKIEITTSSTYTAYKYPEITIYVFVTNKKPVNQYGTIYEYRLSYKNPELSPGIEYYNTIVYDRRNLEDLVDYNVQIDIYEHITKRLRDIYYETDTYGQPILDEEGNKIGTMKYIYVCAMTFGFNSSPFWVSSSGAGWYTPITGSASAGFVNVLLDNIGIVSK